MEPDRIAEAFGLGGGARLSEGPVATGRQGSVWRLETDAGVFAVKLAFAHIEVDEDSVRAAAELHEAAWAAGVPTPRVRRTPDGRIFADVDGARIRVYSWVDLLPPDPTLDPRLIGATLAAIHRVSEPDPRPEPVPDWYAVPVGAQRWDALIDRLRSADAPFAGQLAGLRDELVALDGWVVPPRETRTCHRDLWIDNVRAAESGGVCVFDWENSGPADPAYELACVLFEFGRGAPGRARALVDAYADAGGPAALPGRAGFSMLIAQLGHIAEHAARAWLAAEDPGARADAAAWVGELIDDPHTPAVLDDLLDAVQPL